MAFTHEKCHLLTWQYNNELLKTRQLLPLDAIVKCVRFQISFELCIKSCFNSATKPEAAATNFCLGNLQKNLVSPSLPSPHGALVSTLDCQTVGLSWIPSRNSLMALTLFLPAKKVTLKTRQGQNQPLCT